MRARITAGEVAVDVRAVRLADGRLATAVAPSLAPLLGHQDWVAVTVVVLEPDGSDRELDAVATVVRSGRAWTEARGRLRGERGWTRRLTRSPAEVVVLTPTD